MKNKMITTVIFALLVILLTSLNIFASNTTIKNEMEKSADKTKDTVKDVGNVIQNATLDVTNGTKDALDSTKNGIEDARKHCRKYF